MTLTTRPICAIIVFAATGAAAQSPEYLSYGLAYADLSNNTNTIEVLSGTAGIEYRSGAFVGNGTFEMISVNEGNTSSTLTSVAATAGFFVNDAIVVYGGLNYSDTDPGNETLFTLGAEYMTGLATLGFALGDSNDLRNPVYSFYASYAATDALEFGLFLNDLDNDPITSFALNYDDRAIDVIAYLENDDGLRTLIVDGRYDLGNRFRVSGSYANLNGDVDLLSFGGGYQVVNDIWFDASYGRLDGDGVTGTVDVISLGFTFETGRETLLVDRATTLQARALGSVVGIN